MAEISFYAATAAGALALGVEAHRQFSTRIEVTSQGRFPLLDGVELEALAPQRVYLRGYWFYIACYLSVFLLAVSAVSVGDLILNLSASAEGAGPQGTLPDFGGRSGEIVSRSSDMRPLAIAVAMISLLSLGWIRPIETALRTLAHRMAGIPNSIYRIITRLNHIDYTSISTAGPTERDFAVLAERLRASDLAVSDRNVQEALNNLRVIDILEPPLIGAFQDRVFPVDRVERLDQLITEQRQSIRAVQQEIKKWSGEDAPMPSDVDVAKLMSDILDGKRNLQALFAVLYTKSHGRPLGDAHAATTEIIARLRRPEGAHLRDSLLGAAVISLILIVVVSVLLQARAFASEDMTDVMAVLTDGRDRGFILRDSFRLSLSLFVMVVVAAGLTITSRRSRKDEDVWPVYKLRRIPWTTLLGTALFPAVAAAFCVFGALFVAYMVSAYNASGAFPSTSIVAAIVADIFPQSLTNVVYGLLVGLAVLFVADQHDRLRMRQTVGLAFAFVLPLAIASFLLGLASMAAETASLDRVLRDASLTTLYTTLVVTLFAFFVERAEGVDESGERRE